MILVGATMTQTYTLIGSHRRTLSGFAIGATVLVALGAAAEETRFIDTPSVPFPALASGVAPYLSGTSQGFDWAEPSSSPLQQVFRSVHPDAPLPGMSELIVRVRVTPDAGAATDAQPIRVDLFHSAHDYHLRRAEPSERELHPGANALPLSVPVGAYVLRVYRDENGNGRLDTNMLGQPSEPVAYSNAARHIFGEPDWADARFRLTGGTHSVEVTLE